MKELKIAVIGAGNGGIAIAGNLALKEFKVNLYSPFIKEIEPIKKKGGIQLEGEIEGFGKLNLATDNIEEAIKNTEIIMVVTPAFAHREIAEKCAPYLQDNQIIILNPGRTGGALEFNHLLEKLNAKAEVIVAETNTLIYVCRKINSTKAWISGIKKRVSLAALPATKTEKVIERAQVLYPQFQSAKTKNVLETSLDNIGAIFHPAIMLSHEDRIEQKEEFDFYDITPETAELIEGIDKERLETAEAFGITLKSAEQWLEEAYGTKGKTLYEKIINNKAYKGIKAPKEFNVRQIIEDVPYGLISINLLARLTGINILSSTITINDCCLLLNRNFWKEGRNLEKMGLLGMSIEEIKDFVNYSLKPIRVRR